MPTQKNSSKLLNESQCHGKKMYYSEGFAKSVVEKRILESKKPLKLRIYNCPNCLQWHLTSKEKLKE